MTSSCGRYRRHRPARMKQRERRFMYARMDKGNCERSRALLRSISLAEVKGLGGRVDRGASEKTISRDPPTDTEGEDGRDQLLIP